MQTQENSSHSEQHNPCQSSQQEQRKCQAVRLWWQVVVGSSSGFLSSQESGYIMRVTELLKDFKNSNNIKFGCQNFLMSMIVLHYRRETRGRETSYGSIEIFQEKKKRLNEDHNCNMRKGGCRYNQDVELPGFGDSLNMTVKVKRIIQAFPCILIGVPM